MAGIDVPSLSDTASWFSATADQRVTLAIAGDNVSRSLESCLGQQSIALSRLKLPVFVI